MIGLLIVLSIWKDKLYNDTLIKNQKVTVTILNVVCLPGKGQSSLYFRDQQNKINHVNINNQDCPKYNKGDAITVLYNQEQGWYFIQPN